MLSILKKLQGPERDSAGAQTLPDSVPSDREPWLLVSNCQALGLANCLNLLTDQIHVEHHDPASFRNNADGIVRRWDSFARVLVAPQLQHMLPDSVRNSEKIWQVPTVSFNAYHPDIFYLTSGGKMLKGPLGDYHSAIAYASFVSGRSIEETLLLYNEAIYTQLGYLHCWDGAKMQLLSHFEQAGFDLRLAFANWSRSGAFMYSVNHVKMHCLIDIAKAVLRRAGKQVAYLDQIPHDNLMNGAVFPVYPEIASRLGVQGSYLFKLVGKYSFIRLDQFVSESFSLYANTPGAAVLPEHSPRIERTLQILGATR